MNKNILPHCVWVATCMYRNKESFIKQWNLVVHTGMKRELQKRNSMRGSREGLISGLGKFKLNIINLHTCVVKLPKIFLGTHPRQTKISLRTHFWKISAHVRQVISKKRPFIFTTGTYGSFYIQLFGRLTSVRAVRAFNVAKSLITHEIIHTQS